MVETITGIYAIVNLISGKHYVGQAINVYKRWSVHLAELGKGHHHSKHLQRSWDKNGAALFYWVVLVECPEDELDDREQFWMDRLNAVSGGFNVLPNAGSCRGYQMPLESRAKMSKSAKQIALRDGESERRAERARLQHVSGVLGYHTRTEDGKRRFSEKMRGHYPVFTDEVKAKMRAAWTPERRAAQAERVKNNPKARRNSRG